MILLSDHAIKQKEGGQSLVGGLDVHVCRNYFGSQVLENFRNVYWLSVLWDVILGLPPQIHSSILPISLSKENHLSSIDDCSIKPCSGVFIRAPAILQVSYQTSNRIPL